MKRGTERQTGRRMPRGEAARLVCISLVSLLFLSDFAGAQVKKVPHKECKMCHTDEDRKAIKSKISETCLKCHPESKGKDHRVGMAATVIPEKLPLAEGNIITCATCHDQHDKGDKERMLRMEFNALCKACHKF